MKNIILKYNVVEQYLQQLNNANLDTFLSDFKQVITYNNPQEIKTGLLKYDKKPENKIAFLFIMPTEKIQIFHTVGMKFPIKISFWNSKKEIVYTPGVVKPGLTKISSQVPAKYVVEIPE